MQTKTYKTIDRTALDWPSGEWDAEPDKKQWPDKRTGLPCLAVRHSLHGHWCGYVGVPPSHPLYGIDDANIDLDVHGDVTFTNTCRPGETEESGICHLPDAGETDDVWWIGFDCAHYGDSSPSELKNSAVQKVTRQISAIERLLMRF